MKYVLAVCVWAIVLAGFVPASTAQKTAEELIEQINRLPSPDRQRRLEEGAKKEREVDWYSTMNREDSNDLIHAFETEHSYLKVNFVTGGGPKTFNRIAAEYRAGAYLYDTTGYRATFLAPTRKAGVVMRYRTPLREFLRPCFFDQEGYFNATFTRAYMFIVNKNLVAPKDYPRSFANLLEPKWKGKLVMDNESYDLLAALLDHYGDAEGRRIAEALGKQEPGFRRGTTLVGQLVAAGEFPVMVDGSNHLAYDLKKKGAPIDYLFPEPFVPVMIPQAFWVAARPPHPHAAALFVDFMLSKKGQEIMAN
ncbi:MAG TPA: extracellular solute-binding protein, partial [Terriglobales bacterium]|nr:extracellular solute-binding protein [Terriglobales bacterium]